MGGKVDIEEISDYEDPLSSRGKPPKKPARKPTGQKRKFASKLVPRHSSREQRSSSDASVARLLQSDPLPLVETPEEEEGELAISREAYAKLREYRAQYEAEDYDLPPPPPEEYEDQSGARMPVSSVTQNISELDTLLADLSSARYTAAAQQQQQQHEQQQQQQYKAETVYVPARPPPPASKKDGSSPVPPIAARIPRRRPPKLMHILSKDGRTHDLAKEAREDYNMDLDVELEQDYDYSFSVAAPSVTSNYSTLGRSREPDYDYSTLAKSEVPVSEEELEKATGAGPRGDRSRLIETDSGVVQSKYRYMGFGLWENLDPDAPKKPKKKSPPPPPPKAEPIMYACTVSVSKTISSKELDDLVCRDMFGDMKKAEVEVADGVGDLGDGIGDLFEVFEKEDMTPSLQPYERPSAPICCVCNKPCLDRVITAMGNKFHPKCFVCTYCRGPFRDRKYKTDPRDRKPYCKDCFEKLLGHYGDAHEALGQFVQVHAALG